MNNTVSALINQRAGRIFFDARLLFQQMLSITLPLIGINMKQPGLALAYSALAR